MVAERHAAGSAKGCDVVVLPRFGGDVPAAVTAIGNTPLLQLRGLARRFGIAENVEIWLKAEWTNPGGSVKDRPGREIVNSAMLSGELGPGRTLLDSTSGNTGIAYAMLGAAWGFPVELIMPENASEERKTILRAYGAKVTYSDAQEGSDGASVLAHHLAKSQPDKYYFADQYNNPANVRSHYETTGPEIWRQSGGKVSHFLAAMGTTGTMMGTGSFLRERNPNVQLLGVQPDESFHGIEGIKHLETNIVPGLYDPTLINEQLDVATEEAYVMARELARCEGLFTGISTGASVAAMIRAATKLCEEGESAFMVAVSPDSGSRYLSTSLWG